MLREVRRFRNFQIDAFGDTGMSGSIERTVIAVGDTYLLPVVS